MNNPPTALLHHYYTTCNWDGNILFFTGRATLREAVTFIPETGPASTESQMPIPSTRDSSSHSLRKYENIAAQQELRPTVLGFGRFRRVPTAVRP
jgi:hypothetical protein